MPEWMLPATFVALLDAIGPCFRARSFENFQVVAVGWVHALSRHRISDVIGAAGSVAGKHFSAYYRLLSRAKWSLDEVGIALLAAIVRWLGSDTIELVLDDTLTHRTGKKVALASMHADLNKSQGRRPFFSYGHVFVVLSVHVRVPALAPTGWALPILFRLYEGPSPGGRDDAPSQRRRARGRKRGGVSKRRRPRLTDRHVVGRALVPCAARPDVKKVPKSLRPTKLQLATEMLLFVARRFPGLRFRVLADQLYNGRTVLKVVHRAVDNMSFVVHGRDDAALYELPPKYCGKGRPRVRGKRLESPAKWASRHRKCFERVKVDLYGKQVPVRLGSFVAMSYRTLPGRLARFVVVEDPAGLYRTKYLMCTDPELTAREVVEAYARRWPLERTFQEAKQKLGIEHPQVQRPEAVRRAVPIGLLIYSFVVLWYLRDGRAATRSLPPARSPWYQPNGRASFTDMLATLRRCGWASAFADPASLTPARSKVLANYLQRVVAAA